MELRKFPEIYEPLRLVFAMSLKTIQFTLQDFQILQTENISHVQRNSTLQYQLASFYSCQVTTFSTKIVRLFITNSRVSLHQVPIG